jgi:hypothetical protein
MTTTSRLPISWTEGFHHKGLLLGHIHRPAHTIKWFDKQKTATSLSKSVKKINVPSQEIMSNALINDTDQGFLGVNGVTEMDKGFK